MQVLDASAFIHDYTVDEQTATVPAVKDELDDEESRLRFEAEVGAGLRVHAPAEETVARVRRAADRSGDGDALSIADIDLLAAAVELDATLVTDDYAVQNVAERLEVTIQPIARDGIEETRSWEFQCAGCGRTFEENRERCPVCGADLSRKNPA
jgi:UPF0271 protein